MKSLQDIICDHIHSSRTPLTKNYQYNKLVLRLSKRKFLIGDECALSANKALAIGRYFPICFWEVRSDVLFVQLTPIIDMKTGYLHVAPDGKLGILDEKFKNYRASVEFYFDQGTLKVNELLDIEGEQRFSSKCLKGLCGLSMFAAGAALLYCGAKYAAKGDIDLTGITRSAP